MEYLVEDETVYEKKIEIFSKEYIKKYGTNHKVVMRRLIKELKVFDEMNIDYTISINPILKKSLNRNNLVQIEFIYLNYKLYIFIPEYYPFERPLLMIDKLSIDERNYRIQDGLENTIIHSLHHYISTFVNNTNVDDLISIKEFVEEKFVVPKNINEIDPRRVYYLKVEKYFAPTVLLNESYKIMIEGIHLGLHIDI